MSKRRKENPARRIAQDCLAVRVRMLNRAVTGIYDEALRSSDKLISPPKHHAHRALRCLGFLGGAMAGTDHTAQPERPAERLTRVEMNGVGVAAVRTANRGEQIKIDRRGAIVLEVQPCRPRPARYGDLQRGS